MHTLTTVVQDKWPLFIMWAVMVSCASYCDKTLRLPNLATFPLMIGGFILGAIHDGGSHPDAGTGGFQASGTCLILAFVLLLPSFATGGFPAGGVKLQMGFSACIGAFYGLPRGLLTVALSSLLLATLMAVLVKVKSYKLRDVDPKACYDMPIGFITSFVAIGSMLSLELLA